MKRFIEKWLINPVDWLAGKTFGLIVWPMLILSVVFFYRVFSSLGNPREFDVILTSWPSKLMFYMIGYLLLSGIWIMFWQLVLKVGEWLYKMSIESYDELKRYIKS